MKIKEEFFAKLDANDTASLCLGEWKNPNIREGLDPVTDTLLQGVVRAWDRGDVCSARRLIGLARISELQSCNFVERLASDVIENEMGCLINEALASYRFSYKEDK